MLTSGDKHTYCSYFIQYIGNQVGECLNENGSSETKNNYILTDSMPWYIQCGKQSRLEKFRWD
jgi:hypothetical protein